MQQAPAPDRDTRRRCEVRPSWSSREWATVVEASQLAGLPPATWAALQLTAALMGVPHAGQPAWCTRRGHLWVQLLERWQSISWGLVAVRDRVAGTEATRISRLVAQVGAAVDAQAAAVPLAERTKAGEVCGVAGRAVGLLGAGQRRTAGRVSREAAAPGHRAKLAITGPVREQLRAASRSGGWSSADYAGAVTSLAACLIVHDPKPAAEAAALRQALDEAQATARAMRGLLDSPESVDPDGWSLLSGGVDGTWRAIGQAMATRTNGSSVAAQALIPDAFLALGWTASWGVTPR